MAKLSRTLGRAKSAELVGGTGLLVILLVLLALYCGVKDRPIQPHTSSNTTNVHLANSTSFLRLLDALLVTVSSHAETVAKRGPDLWDGMGNIAEVRQEVLDFLSYADHPRYETLCEVGFNAGHSATVLLSASSKSTLHVFDIADLPFASAQAKLMKRAYGERFKFYKGNSVNLLPWFKQKKQDNTQCDLFSIDGDHSYEGGLPFADLAPKAM
jgi:hypothetical protein